METVNETIWQQRDRDNIERRAESQEKKRLKVPRRSQVERKEFVREFMLSRRVKQFPMNRIDMLDENLVDVDFYTGDASSDMRRAVEYAMRCVGEKSPDSSSVIASSLLSSEDEENLCCVVELQPDKVTYERVLAHLMSFDFKISDRLASSIARRAVLVLMNDSKYHLEMRAELERRSTKKAN